MSHQIIARTTQAKIVALEPDLAETIRVVLEVDDSEFEFLAGQWLNLGVWMDGELKVGGYSFASSPSELPRFELGIKDSARNPVSRYFHRDAAVGDSVTVDGGHGRSQPLDSGRGAATLAAAHERVLPEQLFGLCLAAVGRA